MKKSNSTEGTVWVARIFFVILLIVGIFASAKKSGDKIDKPFFFADAWTGSFLDFLGLLLMILGAAWILGIISWIYELATGSDGDDVYDYGEKRSPWINITIGAVAFIVGAFMIRA